MIKVKLECQNCEVVEDYEVCGAFLLLVGDDGVHVIHHDLADWQRIGLLLRALKDEWEQVGA